MALKVEDNLLYIWSGQHQFELICQQAEVDIITINSITRIKKIYQNLIRSNYMWYFDIITYNDTIVCGSTDQATLIADFQVVLNELKKYHKQSFLNIHKPRPFNAKE
jgi:hypothetical protein